MINEQNFKELLIQMLALEKPENTSEEITTIIDKLRIATVELDVTGNFTFYSGYKGEDWNTCCTFLKISTSVEDIQYLKVRKDVLTRIAREIYDKQGNNVLVDTHFVPSLTHDIPRDFTYMKRGELVSKAILEAEDSMSCGHYDLAVDRVHTAIHGYFIYILEENEYQVQNDERLSKLYNDIQGLIESKIEPAELAQIVKTTVRSASGIIDSLNSVRNKHSLAHPNPNIIGENEAKLVVSLARDVSEYISEYLD